MNTKLSQIDFDAFVTLVGGRVVRWPLNNSSKLVVEIPLTETVTMALNCTVINVTKRGSFYGRNDEYTHVVVPTSDGHGFCDQIHFHGKGARGDERRVAAMSIFELL
jgi:hypothetical protein